jgi:hypothetical protein
VAVTIPPRVVRLRSCALPGALRSPSVGERVGEAGLDRGARLEGWGAADDRPRPLAADAECLDRWGLGDGDGAAVALGDVVDSGLSTATALSPVVSV